MTSRLILEPGREVEFEYPAHNLLGVPLEYVHRRVLVDRVVEIANEPVPAEAFLRRPLVRRGSLLLFAHDLDCGIDKAFYVEAIRSGRKAPELPAYRLGLYDPDDSGEMVDWVGRVFRPTVRDRLVMRDAIVRCEEMLRLERETDLQLAAFPVKE